MTDSNDAINNLSKPLKSVRNLFSLAHKMALAIAGLLAFALSLVWLLISLNIEFLLEKQAAEFGHSFAKQAANSAAELILAEDNLGLNVLVNNIVGDDNIIEATIYSKDGTTLASAPQALIAAGNSSEADNTFHAQPLSDSSKTNPLINTSGHKIPFIVNVKYKGLNTGFVKITLDRSRLERAIHGSLKKISIATLVITALSIAAAFFLGKWLAKPVSDLVEAAENLAINYEEKIEAKREDEIGQVIDTLNKMADGLETHSAKVKTLSRLVPPTVATKLTESKNRDLSQGQYVNATVMFVDMVGFTSLSENMRPQTVSGLLNRYFGLINKVAKLYNGNVDKYMGDGAMIVFGTPQDDDEHCFHALCCARLFIQIIDHHNKTQGPGETIQFRVGIHSGEMIAATMGSEDQMQYTVIGDSVNLAARLSDIGTANQIIISSSVLEEKEIRARIVAEDYQEVLLKGKSNPTKSFRLIGMQDPYAQLIERQVQHLLKQVLAS